MDDECPYFVGIADVVILYHFTSHGKQMTYAISVRKISAFAQPKAVLLILLFTVIGTSIWLLGFKKANLHCDQYSSFPVAVFDFEPHPEEAFERELPLIFSKPTGYFLRAYFLIFYVAALLAFPIMLVISILRSRVVRSMFAIWLILFALTWVNFFLPESIQGERMQFISHVCALYFATLSPLVLACNQFLLKPRHQNQIGSLGR